MIELYVRFGVPDEGPRDVETFTFETVAERKAFISGMVAVSSRCADMRGPAGPGSYDIAQSPDDPDPEWEEGDEV